MDMTKQFNTRRTLAATCAAVAFCLGAGTLQAGEVTGNGKSLKPLNGRSACAYSGLQDNYEEDVGLFKGILTQNWGQMTPEMKAFLTSVGMHPGDSCNPNTAGGEP
jgi:putative intracellular protease/amidase